MTDIILINFRNERDMYPPFGIMYVADALMQEGYSVQIWHEEEDQVDAFVRAVEQRAAPVGRLQHHHRSAAQGHHRGDQAGARAGNPHGLGRRPRHDHAGGGAAGGLSSISWSSTRAR